MLHDNLVDAIGQTPLLRLRDRGGSGAELYAKLELQNIFAMKDRVAKNIILEAKRLGVLEDGAPIVESSSGTMALGVALVGVSLGHPVHIVTDPRIDRITLAKLRSLGCEVCVVAAMTGAGWQSARLERLEEFMIERPEAFWPRQYSNPDNPVAYRALAEELLADLDRIDVLVGSVGSGGSLCGTARALRAAMPGLVVVGVDCVGSALFDQPDRPQRLQSGLGNSLLPGNLDRRLIDEVHWLNDHEAFSATRALAAEQQIFAGNTSGSVYRVMCDLAARAGRGVRVVGIFPDRGDRYVDTVYSDDHWRETNLRRLPAAAASAEVSYGTEVATWSRAAGRGAAHSPQHLLFVESNTTGTGMLALGRARRLGLRPVLVTADPSRYTDLPGDCDVRKCDTSSTTAMREFVQQTFRREELAGVTSTSEYFIPAVARLTEWLGLDGNPLPAVDACRDKSMLRHRLAEAGVRQPRFVVVTAGTPAVAGEAIRQVGAPCVVKPVDDSGSHNVLLCRNAREVAAQVQRILTAETNVRGLPAKRYVLIEEYLDGPEFSVEVIGDEDGLHCVGITEKRTCGLPNFVECEHLFPAAIPLVTADGIRQTAFTALRAAGLLHGVSHSEVRLVGDQAAVVEVNPRPAGGMIPELVRLVSGIDLLDTHILAAAGRSTPLAGIGGPRTAGIRFVLAREDGVFRGADLEQLRKVRGVAQAVLTAELGAEVRRPRSAYDRIGHVIAVGEDHGEVRAVLDEAFGLLNAVVVPYSGRD